MAAQPSRLWTFSSRGLPSSTLTLTTRPQPTLPPPLPLPRDAPTPEEWLLIKVSFAGLNPGAIFQMTLIPPFLRTASCTPDMDFSGVVIDAWHPNGEEKARFKKGDAVVAMLPAAHMLATGTGALAEHVAVPAKYVVHKPESVGLADAAGAMLPGLTAWELVAAAKLKPGDRVLINAAAGGIGSMVVQMVRNAVGKDGYIVGISGTKNQSLVRSLGADETVDYTIHSNLPSHLAILFSPRPFDAIIDAIGVHALFVSSPSYLVPNGVYSSVGVRPPDFSVPNFFRAVIRMKLNEWWPVSSWLGGFGRLWHGVSVMAPSLEDRQRVADLLGKGDVRVVRDSIWKFEDVKLAYERLASGHVSGKILVKVDAALDDDA